MNPTEKQKSLTEKQRSFSDRQKQFLREYFTKRDLSKSEVEVVILVLQGLINKKVAEKLCVAEKTIKFHLGNAYKKLKIYRRSELIWTLPLADFINVGKDHRNILHKNPSTAPGAIRRFPVEEEIPAGISTVNDFAANENV